LGGTLVVGVPFRATPLTYDRLGAAIASRNSPVEIGNGGLKRLQGAIVLRRLKAILKLSFKGEQHLKCGLSHIWLQFALSIKTQAKAVKLKMTIDDTVNQLFLAIVKHVDESAKPVF
jgi:hypothetical protein